MSDIIRPVEAPKLSPEREAKIAAEWDRARELAANDTWTGPLYNPELTLKQIAEKVREAIKTDAKRGVLPPGKYRVTARTFTGVNCRPQICIWANGADKPLREHLARYAEQYNYRRPQPHGYLGLDSYCETAFNVLIDGNYVWGVRGDT